MSDAASRTLDELRESEARLKAIVTTAGTPIVCTDAEFRITEFNPAAERAFGRTREEVLGRRYSELLPAIVREKVDRDCARVLAGGAIQQFENVIDGHAGEMAILLWDVRCLRDASGVPVGLVAVGHDITARQDGAASLARRGRELQILASLQRASVGVSDPERIAVMALDYLAQLIAGSTSAVYALDATSSEPFLLAHTGEPPKEAPTSHAADYDGGGELVLPLTAAGEQIGLLYVALPETGGTTVRQAELAAHVADTIATALYVARLKRESPIG